MIPRRLRPLLAGCLAALWATVAVAQTAVLRSGEHDGFTRLVIDLPTPGTATLDQNGREVSVTLAQPVAAFDLAGVFRRIKTDRIADLRAMDNGRGLMVTLACDCEARLFRAGDRMLAIDVSAATSARTATQQSTADPVAGSGQDGTVSAGMAPVLPLIPTRAPGPAPDLAVPDAAQSEALRQAELRILEQLGRAASQGLLTPRTGTLDSAARVRDSQPAVRDATMAPVAVPVLAQTARDAALSGTVRADGYTLAGRQCPTGGDFDVAQWGGTDFVTGLGAWRTRQFGEFDKPDTEASRGLARHYIHYGFGAEARQALRLAAMTDATLLDMAAIVDGDTDQISGALSGLEGCDSAVALWAVLSAPRLRQPNVDAAAVGRAFLALPEGLQQRLGPDLAQALTGSGAADAAEAAAMILRRLGMAGHGADPAVRLGEISLAAGSGDAGDLAPVIASNTALSAQALSQMIAAEVSAGRPVTGETAELAAAFAFEQRNGPDAAALGFTEILARAAAGEFSVALSLAVSASLAPGQLAQVFDLLTERAADHDFVAQVMIHSALAVQLPADRGNAVAERLLALGFADQAEPLLAAGADGIDGQTRRLLRARVALAQSMPRRAEAELLGLEGPAADMLRARARDMAGDFSAAARIYDSLQANSDGRRADFRAGNWPELAARDASGLGDIARIKTAPAPDDIAGVLARNRALLEESASVRDALERMLNDLTVAPGG